VTVLADTSVWVDFLKLGARGPGGGLATLLTRREVVVCGQVVAELLAGTPPSGRAELWMLMAGLPWIDLRHDGWRRVGELEGDLLARGYRIPLTDVAIAVIAIDGRASLWSGDTHFAQVAQLVPELQRFEPPQ
jgi:predicted nucleic acid-binding protein